MRRVEFGENTMTSLIVTQDMLTLLKQVRETVEIRDSQGVVIGHFAPTSTEPMLNEGRLPKKSEPGKTYTLKEVYQHLLAVSPDEERKAILNARLDEMAQVRYVD
jgi:hypothetical protein